MKPKLDKISWDNVITFNPTFGFDLFGDLPQGGIKIPAYGFFGGPQNTRPLPPSEEPKGVDALDTLFGRHDVALSSLLQDRFITQEEVPAESTKNRGRCSGSGAACTLKCSEIHR